MSLVWPSNRYLVVLADSVERYVDGVGGAVMVGPQIRLLVRSVPAQQIV